MVPVVPFWKNMAMMAVIASLEFAISAWSFLTFSAGSSDLNKTQIGFMLALEIMILQK